MKCSRVVKVLVLTVIMAMCMFGVTAKKRKNKKGKYTAVTQHKTREGEYH